MELFNLHIDTDCSYIREYIPKPFRILLIVFKILLPIFLIATIILFPITKETKAAKDEVVEEFNTCQSIISYAEENPSYILKGKIVKMVQSESFDEWVISYTIDSNGQQVEFSTYSMFSQEVIEQYKIGDTILIAKNPQSSQKVRYVCMVMKDYDIKDIAEYRYVLSFHSSLNGLKITFLLLCVISIASIIVIYVYFLSIKNKLN